MEWKLAAGDIQAAFLNGEEARRDLYMRQPVRGLPGMHEEQIVEVVKGIFGLATSPRLWWKRLASELTAMEIYIKGEKLTLHHHVLDSCMFILRDESGEMRGALATHVDDILLAAPKEEITELQKNLSGIFPISEWESDTFEYIGSDIEQNDNGIHVGQSSYVKSRLETVDIPKGVNPEDVADEVTRLDNQSVVGGLSWLASQTRPDLQTGVSMAQRKQKHPTYADVKETNKVVKLAQENKDERLIFRKVGEKWEDLVILAFHDAAWANAPEVREEAGDLEMPNGVGIYSQLGHILMLTHRDVLEGKEANAMICGWKSHACDRVCRSTFAAETMAAMEGLESAMAFRASLVGTLLGGGLSEERCRHVIPIVPITDCRSLYDTAKREGGPRAPSERRLVVDLAALRQILEDENNTWGRKLAWPTAMRSVPTDYQMADVLTKVKNAKTWWASARSVKLPFGQRAT